MLVNGTIFRDLRRDCGDDDTGSIPPHLTAFYSALVPGAYSGYRASSLSLSSTYFRCPSVLLGISVSLSFVPVSLAQCVVQLSKRSVLLVVHQYGGSPVGGPPPYRSLAASPSVFGPTPRPRALPSCPHHCSPPCISEPFQSLWSRR